MLFFDGKVGEGFYNEDIDKIKKEGESRYKTKTPPGYCDGNQKQDNEYGDLFIWKEIIRYAKENDKDVIFVTQDVKEDWWFKEKGKTIGPRYELRETIIDYLNKAELVIADMSGHNPNEFYEMGFRACTGKPMINLREKGENIPFDISTIRAFEYDLSDLDSVDEVKRRLEQTINSFNIEEDNEELEGELVRNETDNNESDKGISGLLPVLYEIQDQITDLKEEIHNKDTEMIQAIIKAANPPAPAENPDTVLMKILIPEMIKNPNSFKTLMELSEKAQKNDKKQK